MKVRVLEGMLLFLIFKNWKESLLTELYRRLLQKKIKTLLEFIQALPEEMRAVL